MYHFVYMETIKFAGMDSCLYLNLSMDGDFKFPGEHIGEGCAINIRNQEQIADIELSQSQVCTPLSSIKMTNLCSHTLFEAINYYVSMPLLVLLDKDKLKGSLFIDHQMALQFL